MAARPLRHLAEALGSFWLVSSGQGTAVLPLERLFASDAGCTGLLLFGSHAREEATGRSDLDLLLLYEGSVPEHVLDEAPPEVSICFYDEKRLSSLWSRSPLFAVHLRDEGRRLYDPREALRRFQSEVPTPSRDRRRTLGSLTLKRLDEVLEHPGFDAHSAVAGAELFALVKQAAMLASGAFGRFEFNRDRALALLAAEKPRLAPDILVARRAEESWLAVRRDTRGPLPYGPGPSVVAPARRIVMRVANEL